MSFKNIGILYWQTDLTEMKLPQEVQGKKVRYRVKEVLGEGSFGKVYKGVNTTDFTEVALKFISKMGKSRKDLAALESQNMMLQDIKHENIISLLDYIDTKTAIIIVTDFAGEDLAGLLKKHRDKRFSYSEVQNFSRQIFSALLYLYENKITHRDLKPANILIKDGIVKICDFGFARKLSASTNFMNSLKGTPLYIAPEILEGKSYTHKVDIWSFGIIIYELFLGRTPFYADTLHQLKPKILTHAVKFTETMPIQFKTLIGGMLQKNPINRFDWSDLQKHEFFQAPRLEIESNIMKSIENVPMEKKVSEKVEEEREKASSDVVHLLEGVNDIEEIKNLEKNLIEGIIDPKELRTDHKLYDKIMSILGSYCVGQKIVQKEVLLRIFSIFNIFIKKAKLKTAEEKEMDMLNKKDLIFCLLKIADAEEEAEYLEKEIMIIGFLIKVTFNNVSIDFEIDQDLTDLCIKELKAPKSIKTFDNAMKLLGTLANQGVLTLLQSQAFFIRVEEQEIVKTIAQQFEQALKISKQAGKRQILTVFLECLQCFIHPVFKVENNQNSEMKKIFKNMRLQAANALIQKKLLTFQPQELFDERGLELYCMILYQCISNCDKFRKEIIHQSLEQKFWPTLMENKRLRNFIMFFDFTCYRKQSKQLLPKETFRDNFESPLDKMENIFSFARAGYEITKKQSNMGKISPSKALILQISIILNEAEEIKEKSSKSIEGFLTFGERVFEEVLAQTFYSIFKDNRLLKKQVSDGLILSIVERLFDVDKVSKKLRVNQKTVGEILIILQEMSMVENINFVTNKRFLKIMATLFSQLLYQNFFFQIAQQEDPTFSSQCLCSIFTFLKFYGTIEENQQFTLYCKAEEKGIHTLMVSNEHLNRKTISLVLSLQLRIGTNSNRIQTVIDFLGMNLLGKLQPFIKKVEDPLDEDLIIQVLQAVSILIKKNENYIGAIKSLNIISFIPSYLMVHNETLRYHTLMLIGHLSKHSQYFFEDFAKENIFGSIVESMNRQGSTNASMKIMKSLVYAIGNVSFYSDRYVVNYHRFFPQIVSLLPYFSKVLKSEDAHSVTNTISTVSNLLRHNGCYIKELVHHKIIQKIIQIIIESNTVDNKMKFGLNTVKKLLNYSQEVIELIGKEEFIRIYREKKGIIKEGQDGYEGMKKIQQVFKL